MIEINPDKETRERLDRYRGDMSKVEACELILEKYLRELDKNGDLDDE